MYLGWKLMDIAGMTESNQAEYKDPQDKLYLKTVWAIHPLKRVKA